MVVGLAARSRDQHWPPIGTRLCTAEITLLCECQNRASRLRPTVTLQERTALWIQKNRCHLGSERQEDHHQAFALHPDGKTADPHLDRSKTDEWDAFTIAGTDRTMSRTPAPHTKIIMSCDA